MRNLRWAAVALVVALVALGLWGIRAVPLDEDLGAHLYRVLQLFVVEGDWTHDIEPLPWQIQVVRFVAPVFLVAGLVLLFVQGALTALHNATVRFAHDHLIVVGINDLSRPFLASCQHAGRDVVVLAAANEHDAIASVRTMGVRVLPGNVLDSGLLRRAGITRASHLVAFDEDGVNVELALRVRDQLRRGGRETPLKMRLHLFDTRLGERLEAYPKFFDDADVAEISLFNVGERTALALLRSHPLEAYADVLGLARVHVALFGFNEVARHVVLDLARLAHFADGEAPRLTIVDDDASDHYQRLVAEYPQLPAACEVECFNADLASEYVVRELAESLTEVSTYVVARHDDIRNVEFSLHLRHELLAGFGLNAPILVHTRNGGGIARLLEAEAELEGEIPDGLYPFGELREVLSVENVVDERTDELARSIHEHYLERFDERTRPSQADWPALPETYRRENRISAAHVEFKLRALGLRIAPAEGRRAPELEEAEIELLARMEQQRWWAGQLVRGWQRGPQRSETARMNDRIARWSELSEAARDDDRRLVQDLVRVVSERPGIEVAREARIGLWVRGESADEGALEECLAGLQARYPGRVFVVLSTARFPAERLVASMLQARLGARSWVYLPLPDDLYLIDIEPHDAAATLAYRQAVAAAEHYFELPLRFGNHDVLASDALARAAQVALAESYIARRADELIVIGADARPGGGAAGTERDPTASPFPGRFFRRTRGSAGPAVWRLEARGLAQSNNPPSP